MMRKGQAVRMSQGVVSGQQGCAPERTLGATPGADFLNVSEGWKADLERLA
jgi:hypothetical protein